MTYYFDFAMPYITRTQQRDGQKAASTPIPALKGDLGIRKNYRGMAFTFMVVKVLLLNRIELEIEKILKKSQNSFRRYRSTSSQILKIHRIIEGVCAKNLEATLLLVDFSNALDSIHREKMEQIPLAYSLPKEIFTAIMMLYRNAKVKAQSPYGDTDFFDMVAGVQQGDTLASDLFIICLDYLLRT